MKRWLKVLLVILFSALLGIGGYATYLYHSVKNVMEHTYEPIRKRPPSLPKLRKEEVSIQKKGSRAEVLTKAEAICKHTFDIIQSGYRQ